jgi:putative transcriptional regulator
MHRFFIQKLLLAGWMVALWTLLPGILSAGMEREVSKGVFLIADRRLTDPNFRESVVLITHHDTDGSIGVVINRPTTRPLSTIPDPRLKETPSGTLFSGGPVSPSILSLLLQSERPPQEMEAVLNDVYFRLNPQSFAGLKGSKQFRVYAGYAGWAPGQLAAEITRGDWRILPADPVLLFQNDPEHIWPELFRRSEQRSVQIGGPGDGARRLENRPRKENPAFSSLSFLAGP